MKPYRILVTNDDGVWAPGIHALAEALRAVGEVTVVAPAEGQSAKSHGLVRDAPIYADEVTLPSGMPATALAATPASCVQVALAALLPARPDLVVSGINRGYNLGCGAYDSGTVAAARDAALRGIPAIAASLAPAGHPRYGAAAAAAVRLATLVRERGLGRGVFLNLNVPAEPKGGMRIASQSGQTGVERFVERRTPADRRYFWNVYQDPSDDAEGTDVWTTARGMIAVTPLVVGEYDAATGAALADVLG